MELKTLSANKTRFKKKLVDATDQVLGRLSSVVAKIIRGKYKSNYTPHVDCGDNVVIINADEIRLSGEKLNQKNIYDIQVIQGAKICKGKRFTRKRLKLELLKWL